MAGGAAVMCVGVVLMVGGTAWGALTMFLGFGLYIAGRVGGWWSHG